MSDVLDVRDGFPPYGGRQGLAAGTPSGLSFYGSSGMAGYADATTLAALNALIPATPKATATVPLTITLDATATPRVTATATVPLIIATDAIATPRITATANAALALAVDATATARLEAAVPDVPLVLDASAVATPKVRATATVPLTVAVAASARTRIVALVSAVVRLGIVARVVDIVRATVDLGLRVGIRARGTVGGYQRVRVRDTSAPAVTMQDQSEGRPW
jgi:hypothetical protein